MRRLARFPHRQYSTAQDEVYFGANSLNRLSFLRTDPTFVAQSMSSPYAKYIFLDQLAPVVDTKNNKLLSLDYESIGSKNRVILDNWVNQNRERSKDLMSSPLIHFLGVDARKFTPFKYQDYSGIPYYAIEISKHESFREKVYSQPHIKPLETRELVNQHLDYYESNIFAQAKMYLDWISSTPHCKGCGASTIPINAGSELLCSSKDEVKCPVKTAPVSNASFPRLDPVLITCVMNSTYDKVLFTRLSKFPKGMYTHIAGFIEPGETIENAVRREVWEESGLKVSDIQIVRSQPWPYPVNIMLGCVAIVQDTNTHLGHDLELEEAFWVDIKDVKRIVEEGEEDENLTLIHKGFKYGIPNDKTLATKLFQYVVEKYA